MGRVGNLKREEASARAARVSGVSYELRLELGPDGSSYGASCRVLFDLSASAPAAPLFLDFVSTGALQHASLNGAPLGPDALDTSAARLALPEPLLRAGARNEALVRYNNAYDREGHGLHAFEDPADGLRYTYTDFEPFNAHRLLPCFDQPDVRAELRLCVEAPAGWAVRGNAPLASERDAGGGRVLREFAPTPPISTYLFAVIAGPYAELADAYAGRAGRTVPLGLLSRQSLLPQLRVESEELFRLTRAGLAWYEAFFDMQFPFDKYDQIFCPEYNHGAMENVGAVTFTEAYLFRDRATVQQHARRCETVLHEMAHMWFGDLVTPVWWDGLWLNESFATYVGALCQSECAGDLARHSWVAFNAGKKQWGYREDQLPTTHPVQTPVADTDSTFLNFDGVTYGKGAALLKQMVFVVGMDGFREGMRYYFGKHKWGNTTILDFICAINEGAKRATTSPLPGNWIKVWLEEAGLNTIDPILEVDESGVVRSLRARQSAPKGHPTLRQHCILAATYDYEGGKPVLRRSVPVTLDAAELTDVGERIGLVGEKAPAFIWLNQDDHAYADVSLDERSLAFFLEHASELPDTLVRQQVWYSLFSSMRSARNVVLPAPLIRAILRHAPVEQDIRLLQSLLGYLSSCIRNYTPFAQRAPIALEAYNQAMSIVAAEGSDNLSDVALTWARQAASWANYNHDTAQAMFDLVTHAEKSPKWLDQGLRWGVLQSAFAWGLEGTSEALEAERKRDTSDRGARAAITCKSSPLDADVKRNAWARFLDEGTKASLHELEADMNGFWWHHQRPQLRPYADEFFAAVRDIFAKRSIEYARAFFGALSPWFPEDDAVRAGGADLLGRLGPSESSLARYLRDWLDDIDRARKVLSL